MLEDISALRKLIDDALRRIEDLEEKGRATPIQGGVALSINTPILVGDGYVTLADFFGTGNLAKSSDRVVALVLESGKARAKSRSAEVGKIYFVKGVDGDMHGVVDAYVES
ncbi:MAG: hypothetical protein KC978_20420 [Candidatus Omnitrophica bacterium]|nr:hypothetical protein [Candidatus Omnitrophota bacterium]